MPSDPVAPSDQEVIAALATKVMGWTTPKYGDGWWDENDDCVHRTIDDSTPAPDPLSDGYLLPAFNPLKHDADCGMVLDKMAETRRLSLEYDEGYWTLNVQIGGTNEQPIWESAWDPDRKRAICMAAWRVIEGQSATESE